MNIQSVMHYSLAVFTEKSIQKFKDKIMELDISRAEKHEYLEYMAQKISEKMDLMTKYDFREFCASHPTEGVLCKTLFFNNKSVSGSNVKSQVLIQKSALIPGNPLAVNFIKGEVVRKVMSKWQIRTDNGKIIDFRISSRNKANGKPLFKFDAEKYAEVPKPTIIKPPEAFINGQKVRLKDIWDTPISQIKRLVIEFY